jgi:hypothetical protein
MALMSIKRIYEGVHFGDPRLPLAVSDDHVTGGTLFRVDYSNPDCLIGANGSGNGTLKDFSLAGALNARWVPGGVAALFNVNGDGLVMSTANGGTGSTYQQWVGAGYAPENLHTFALAAWVFFDGAYGDASNTSTLVAIDEANSTAVTKFALRSGSIGGNPGTTVNLAGTAFHFGGASASLTQPTHVAAIAERGATTDTVTLYIDGVLAGVQQQAHTDWAYTSPAVKQWGNYGTGVTIYSALVEDCTLSGRDPEQWILSDYANHVDEIGNPTWATL